MGECIQMAGDFYGEKIKLQPIIDTSSTDIKNAFVPASKRKFFIDAENDEVLMEHSLNKRMASKTSRSFIFMSDTFKAFNKAKQHSEYYEVIKELKLYASYYLFVVDTKLMGSISTNIALPLYSNRVDSNYNIFTGMFEFDDMTPKDMEEINESLSSIGMPTILPMGGAFVISASEYDGLKNQFESMNLVIEQLVPGMNVVLKLHSEAMTKAGELGKVVELVTVRDGMEMPLRYESDGVKKIVSVLDLIIKAYNQNLQR